MFLTHPRDFANLHRDLDRFLADFWSPRTAPAAPDVRLEVLENADGYQVRAELPGVKAKDLTVEVVDDVLHLKGSRDLDLPEGAIARRRERTMRSFERSLRFPVNLDARKVEASLEHGILTVDVPKAEEAKPRKIKVRTR